MLELINDYLDFARIGAGCLGLERAEADLMAVVRSAADRARPQCEVKGLHIEVAGTDTLPALMDAARMNQVLDNLVSNAVKYTPDGGRIGLRVICVGDVARVGARDTAAGIPADPLGKLFSKYHRVPGQAAAGIQGTGLGLPIIKEIVQAHGGQVWARSTGSLGRARCSPSSFRRTPRTKYESLSPVNLAGR